MTTQTEEARWARLRSDLEGQFGTWGLTAADYRAAVIVRELRREGWRIPLPDHAIRQETPGTGHRLSADRVRQHADACREALRTSIND